MDNLEFSGDSSCLITILIILITRLQYPDGEGTPAVKPFNTPIMARIALSIIQSSFEGATNSADLKKLFLC